MKWPWQRKPKNPPREGWVTLLDSSGRQVSESIPVVVFGDPLTFTVDHSLTFDQIEASTITSVRVTDADGNAHDVPLAPQSSS